VKGVEHLHFNVKMFLSGNISTLELDGNKRDEILFRLQTRRNASVGIKKKQSKSQNCGEHGILRLRASKANDSMRWKSKKG
jgi:hypothetical protein